MAGNPLDALAKLDPAMLEHLKTADRFVFADGALPAKIKTITLSYTLFDVTGKVVDNRVSAAN